MTNTASTKGQTCGVCGHRFTGSHVAHYAAAHRKAQA